MPEHFTGLDLQYYLEQVVNVLNKTPGAIAPEVVSEYLRCFCCTSTIHSGCEDFRAAAGIDLEMDEADDRVGNKIVAPVHALWGQKIRSGKNGTSLRLGGRKQLQLLPDTVSTAVTSFRKNVPRKHPRN